jgi:hypothetical protein
MAQEQAAEPKKNTVVVKVGVETHSSQNFSKPSSKFCLVFDIGDFSADLGKYIRSV